MLQQEEPDDYASASGTFRTVDEFPEAAFSCLDFDFTPYLVIADKLYRPSQVRLLRGDSSKARKQLEGSPTVSFNDLVKEMMDDDLCWYSMDREILC